MHIHIELTVNEAIELLNQKPQLITPAIRSLASVCEATVEQATVQVLAQAGEQIIPEKPVETKPVESETVVAPEKPKKHRRVTTAEPAQVPAEPTPAVVEISATPAEATLDTNPAVGPLTLDDVRASAIRFANNNGIETFKAVLEKFGVQSVSSLKPELFAVFKAEVEK